MKKMNSNIGVVITTYNRSEKLQIALKCFDEQTILPAYILVINNSSTDNTEDILEKWIQIKTDYLKYYVTTNENLGGSGGFYLGMKTAIKMEADWIWVSDDDAFPEKDAISEACLFLRKTNGDDISAICGAVINNGNIDLLHRRRMYMHGMRFFDTECEAENYNNSVFSLNVFSYVGTIINKEKLIQAGLTNKEYFIWWDDSEHSIRLSKIGKILCIPSIRIHHDVLYDDRVSWRTYYCYRNQADLYKKHFKFHFVCYLLRKYTGVFIRSLFRKSISKNKVVLAGLNDGIRGKLGLHSLYKPGWKSMDD